MPCPLSCLLRALLLVGASLPICQPVVAQPNPLNFVADTAAARRLLDRAQRQMDSSRHELALPNAREAERLLLFHFDSTDVRLADAVCAVGLCLLKIDRTAVPAYRHWALSMLPDAEPLDRAHILFFEGNCLYLLDQNLDAALASYRAAIERYQMLAPPGSPPHQNAARAHSNAGVMLMKMGRFGETFEHFRQAEAWFRQIHGPLHPNLAHPYNNRGLVCWYTGHLREAAANFDTAYSIRSATLPLGHPEIGATLNNIGLVQIEAGAFDEAARWFEVSLATGTALGDTALIAGGHNNLGLVASKKGEHPEALSRFRQTLAFEQAYGASRNEQATTLLNIGAAFKDIAVTASQPTLLDSALFYYRLATEKADPNYESRDRFISAFGVVFEQKRDWPQAKMYYCQGLAMQHALFGTRHPSVASSYFNLANVALAEGFCETALLLNDSAQLALGYTGGADYGGVLSLFYLAQVFSQRDRLLLECAVGSRDEAAWLRLRQSCEHTLDAFRQAERVLLEKADRFTLRMAMHAASEAAITAALRLHALTGSDAWLEDAFQTSENAKAQVLLNAIRESNALHFAGIPPEILRQEQELRQALVVQEGQVLADQAALESYHALRLAHEALLQKLSAEYPAFRRAFVAAPAKGSAWLRDSVLLPGQSLLEYFVGDDSVVLFLVQKSGLRVFSIPKDFPLEKWVDSLTRHGIYAHYTLPIEQRTVPLETSVRTYTKFAHLLFEKLLRPVAPLLGPEVLIVPDGVLSHVPFEALLPALPTRPTVFGTYRFWAEDKQVSYVYSAALLREMREGTRAALPDGMVLALAPFAPAKGGTALEDTLKASGRELDGIAGFFTGKYLKGAEATREVFVEQAPGFRVLHLSTHGYADGRAGNASFLTFGKGSNLYARDLYGLRVNAQLATLSACETGQGKSQRGEGIIGLARAFAFAGTGSIVVSLWKVNDASTADLMVGFYQGLKASKPKDKALCSAKRDFLRANRHTQGGALLHPFFWAGFVAVGDMRPLR